MCAADVGLASVTWAGGKTEVVFCSELERQCGSVAWVSRDPPRNVHHQHLVEVEMNEADFQRRRAEGALGDGDATWPRVNAVYEAQQPLQFDLICRMGQTCRLASPEKADDVKGRLLRLDPSDLTPVNNIGYLTGLTPMRNIYLHLSFDRAHPSRAFCGIFAPAVAEAWVCFSGLDGTEAEKMRPELEQALCDQLTSAQDGSGGGGLVTPVHAEVSFVTSKALSGVVLWAEGKLADVRRKDGGTVCVICTPLSTGELRGVAPSSWVEQRLLRHVVALREMPICRAPFVESDAHFPALDWARWISRRFTSKVPQLFIWWQQRLALCRSSGMPVCNVPEIPSAMVPAALDVLLARQLQQESQLKWASPTCRPDLGETSLALVDAQEETIEVMSWILQGKDLSEGRGGGQINRPGVYRSVCLEVDLRTKLCVCALQHAKYLSDMEGGELSKKFIRKVADGSTGKNLDHTSEVSLTGFESLVNMVQALAEVRDKKEKDVAAMRHAWVLRSGLSPNEVPADDAEFVAYMEKSGCPDTITASKLEELRTDLDTKNKLLDGLYSWLATPTSLLYDAAQLRKVHQYMDKTLLLFLSVLKKNGCHVIHASYSKVLFSTGKLRVIPDVQHFWQSLCENVRAIKPLEPLALNDVTCLSELFYGITWLDPANWAGVPIDPQTGSVIWKARSCWKIADFLPPAVRPSLILYAGELLLGPQRELERKLTAGLLNTDEGAAGKIDDAMDIENGDCDDPEDGECAYKADEHMDVDNANKGDAGAAAKPQDAPQANEDDAGTGRDVASVDKSAEIFEELYTFMKGEFFDDLRRRILKYVEDLQLQQARELPAGGQGDTVRSHAAIADGSDSEGSGRDEDTEEAQARKEEKIRRHLEQKWLFPEVPGRRSPPGAVDFEFMRTLIQIFKLEESLTNEVLALRDRLCQKLNISSFGSAITFENPCFPLILRDVACPWCCTASHIDVTSHPARGPGAWVCLQCKRLYDKEAMQARLVGLLENCVQAWHSQEVTCKKSRQLKTSHMQKFSDCFGTFQLRFSADDFKLVLRMLRSLVGPHDLPWLGEMLNLHEQLL